MRCRLQLIARRVGNTSSLGSHRLLVLLGLSLLGLLPLNASAHSCTASRDEMARVVPLEVRHARAQRHIGMLQHQLHEQEAQLGPDSLVTADTLRRLASALVQLGELEQARTLDDQALAMELRLLGEDAELVAEHRSQMGQRRRDIGRPREGLQLLERAHDVLERIYGPDSPHLAAVLTGLAWAKYDLGAHEEAKRLARRAFVLAQADELENTLAQARSLNVVGFASAGLRQFSEAASAHTRAIELTREARNTEQLAFGFTGLGIASAGLGKYAEAKNCHANALAIRQHVFGADSFQALISLLNLGETQFSLGEWSDAKRHYDHALAISEKILGEQSFRLSSTLHRLGNVYFALNQLDRAQELHQRALTINERVFGPDSLGVAMSLRRLSAVLRHKGDRQAALAGQHRALSITQRNVGADDWRLAVALNDIGVTYLFLGDYGQARAHLERAVAIYERTLGNTDNEAAVTLGNLSDALLRLGEPRQASEVRMRALTILAASGFPPYASWRLLHAHSRALRADGALPAAIFFGKQAVNAIQALRSNITSLDESLRQTFLRDKTGVYRNLADLLVEDGRLVEAQEVVQLLKQEEYFEFIQRSAVQAPAATRLTLSESEQRLERLIAGHFAASSQLANELEKLDSKLKQGEPLTPGEQARRTQLTAELAQARAAFQRVLVALPPTTQARMKESSAVSQQRLAALRHALGSRPAAAIVQYVVSPERLSVLLTLHDRTVSVQVNVSQTTLHRLVRELHDAMSARTDTSVAARPLFEHLIRPLEPTLAEAGVNTLLLSPDGVLRYVPFAALHDGGRYVVERFAISMLTPSAPNPGGRPRPAAGPRVAGLGVTKASTKLGMKALPAVRAELHQIVGSGDHKGLLPGETFLDEAFTTARLRAVVEQKTPIVHIATHFRFQPGNARESFLVLGNDVTLSLEEIRQMNLPLDTVDLLALSACQTAVAEGTLADGVEFEGLGVMLANQGARNVLATLWQVADASSASFMVEFYRQRLSSAKSSAGKMSAAQALRAAQLAFVRGFADEAAAAPRAPATLRRYAHPFFWAAYVLMESQQ